MSLEFFQYPYGSDNYGVLIHDKASGATASVDAGDHAATRAALQQTGWKLSDIWITHHHGDHTAGLAKSKAETEAYVRGPNIAHVDLVLAEGDMFEFAGQPVQVIETPGHTLDMLNFYLPQAKVVFTGDTLFSAGCGRLFEGTAPRMHTSMNKLAALPDETVVYCSHEYTAANVTFALSVDPSNQALKTRAEEVGSLRAKGAPTVPTSIGAEKAFNPFMRTGDPTIRAALGMQNDTDEAVFAELRARKDRF